MRLEFVIADRPVLDGHGVRNGLGAVFLGQHAPDAKVGRQEAPVQRAPMDAGAADTFAGQESAEAPDRQRQLIGRVAEGDGVGRVVLHQFEPHHIAQFVAQPRQRELFRRIAVGAAFERRPH